MPSGLINEEDGVGSWRNRLGDFGQMQVHRFDVTGGQDQSRALSLLRADGSEDVGRGGALIPWSAWASAALGPPAGDLILLADPCLVLEPNFYRPAERGSDQVGEIFLNMTSASGSFCG